MKKYLKNPMTQDLLSTAKALGMKFTSVTRVHHSPPSHKSFDILHKIQAGLWIVDGK